MSTQPTPMPATSTFAEILQAILAGLQIAAQALPLILQYKQAFGAATATSPTAAIVAQATTAHPVTGAIVAAALAEPTA